MTITTHAVGSKASTMYTATVNGSPLPLWSRTTDTSFNSAYWSAGQNVEQSFCTYAADEPGLISISRTAGPVTSAKVYTNSPSGPIIAHTIVAGACRFTLPADTTAWVELNNLRGQPLIINSRPLVTTPSGPLVDTWNGSQTRAVAGRTLLFPAGVHTIGQSFEVDPGASVFFHGEAWVVGSLHFVGSAGGARAFGYGVLSGEWGSALRGSIRALPFEQWIPYTLIYGENATLSNTSVEGVTLLDPPALSVREGPNVYDRICLIAPWWGNASGIWPGSKWPERMATINKCSVFCHDDAFDFGEYLGAHRVDDSIVGSIASASFLVSYWPSPNSNSTHTASRNTLICLNYAGADAGSIILIWCDGGSSFGGNSVDESFHVVSDVVFDGLNFMGSSIFGRPFDIRNRLYPAAFGGPQGQAVGQIRNIVFRNVTFEVVPGTLSMILGKDRFNTPHDLIFENVFFAGVRLTVANASTYFDINEFPYNIYIDGIPLRPNVTSSGSWFATDPATSPHSFQPQGGRLNDGRVYPGPDIWLPQNATLPTRGPYRHAIAPANWSAEDVQLAGTSAGSSTANGFPTALVAVRGLSAGVGTTQGGLRVRQALSALSQGGSTAQANLTKINPSQLAGSSSGTSSAAGGLTTAVALAGVSNGTSTARADLFAPGTVVLAGTSVGTSTATARPSVISQESSSQGEIMKQRIYNALLAVCQAGPFYKADVNVKTGQMSVFTSQKEQPLAVDIVEVSKEFREAANYRRAYNVAEIASWVFAVTVRFRSGVRVSCETFEEQVSDTGIKVPEAKGVVSSRPLLARLTDSRYDEAPAQNPNLGTVVVFTFEVVPETLRK